MLKIPYGISDFSNMPLEGYYYVDRTQYIEQMESRGEKAIHYVRPRRFGKSLFVSMLHHYYGQEYKDQFDALFGQYYIGQHPTKRANMYLVLSFDFSGIDTKDVENTYRGFTENVRKGAISFLGTYSEFFNKKDIEQVEAKDSPQGILKTLFTLVKIRAKGQKVYVLVDEYDHFTNELLSLNFDFFRKQMNENEWVYKFYEVIKRGTGTSIVDRVFLTGVIPVSLDSFTSGYNISTNASVDLSYCEMMGFTESEVIQLLEAASIPATQLNQILAKLRLWYNGYLFHEDGKQGVYNPERVLYFVKYYTSHKKYPEDLLDKNLADANGKIRQLLKVNDTKDVNYEVLQTIIKKGNIRAKLTRKYRFDRPWTEGDFASLLFYKGILSIQGDGHLGRLTMAIPNFVIRQLYF